MQRLARVRYGIGLAAGLLALGISTAAAQPQPPQPVPAAPAPVIPTVAIDPDQPGAMPHWTVTIGAEYCGGYRIGDGVYVKPEAPLALPATVAADGVLFAGQPASVAIVHGVLRVSPGVGLIQSMICIAGQRPLQVELLPSAGLGL